MNEPEARHRLAAILAAVSVDCHNHADSEFQTTPALRSRVTSARE
jgi:hypothetical protein